MVQHILHMTSSFSCNSLVNCQPLSNSQSPLTAFEKLVYACSVQGSSFAGINRIYWHPRNLNFNVFFFLVKGISTLTFGILTGIDRTKRNWGMHQFCMLVQNKRHSSITTFSLSYVNDPSVSCAWLSIQFSIMISSFPASML